MSSNPLGNCWFSIFFRDSMELLRCSLGAVFVYFPEGDHLDLGLSFNARCYVLLFCCKDLLVNKNYMTRMSSLKIGFKTNFFTRDGSYAIYAYSTVFYY